MADSRLARGDHTSNRPAIRERAASAADLAALPPGLHPVLRRVLAARQVSPEQLQPALSQLIPVGALPGVDAAAERLVLARQRDERLLVVGDFDADGATAAALCVEVLRAFGFAAPDFLVPDRFTLGYGLSPGIVEIAVTRRPDLIITVDNGITSLAGVLRARELGIEVIITDHHLAGDCLPAADWIVAPNLPGTAFGSPALCGVGVAFYLMAATGRRLAALGIVSPGLARDAVTATLDLVALGTVADLVALDFNNRILVTEGLRRIRAGRSRPGVEALYQVAGRDPALARAGDLGYAIAPRLNAAGRLDDMTIGIQCLLARDSVAAQGLAGQLDRLNQERRILQDRMQAEAEDLLAAVAAGDSPVTSTSCLFDARWHPGVVGLVASRIRERTGRPAIAFARATEPGVLRGSARSIEQVHVRDAIAGAVARLPQLDIRFGGHAMAAGLTLPEVELPAFRAAFDAELERLGAGNGDSEILWTDGGLEAADLGLELADLLAGSGPWGQGFAEPLFVNRFRVREQRVVAEKHLRLSVQHEAGGQWLDAIAFGQQAPRSGFMAKAAGLLRLVYRLDINTWRDTRRAQLVVEHLDCV